MYLLICRMGTIITESSIIFLGIERNFLAIFLDYIAVKTASEDFRLSWLRFLSKSLRPYKFILSKLCVFYVIPIRGFFSFQSALNAFNLRESYYLITLFNSTDCKTEKTWYVILTNILDVRLKWFMCPFQNCNWENSHQIQ